MRKLIPVILNFLFVWMMHRDYDYGGDASPDKKGYVTFGKVISGMKYVKQIHEQPEFETNFLPPIKIINIKRLN